ncbi:hypothetical protein [Eubacterium sp.]|uniref:hypothetical protein n=1 Tax=Eubacterium sp. TaxID=142586 RepID=UPI0034143A07
MLVFAILTFAILVFTILTFTVLTFAILVFAILTFIISKIFKIIWIKCYNFIFTSYWILNWNYFTSFINFCFNFTF